MGASLTHDRPSASRSRSAATSPERAPSATRPGTQVRSELEQNDVPVLDRATVTAIGEQQGRLVVLGDPNVRIDADIGPAALRRR
jgi:hypothetical protein